MISEKQKTGISDDQLIAHGFQKNVKDNGLVYFSKRIQKTSSDFIIMKSEDGLYSAPQIHTPGVPLNKMIIDSNQDKILDSMDEVNAYYQKALKNSGTNPQ